ncbi:head GIN domain-containing protein [Pelagerythrobacter sp.]|uniref:head GIN domain-containing protein n=1 Tax=Pelagerythrobacter sp. TaxID=2800702 RepID=UPI0035B3BDFE
MLHKILKGVAPVVALMLASGCNGNININGSDGVPLGELDMTGKTPTEVVAAGPDNVIVTRGAALDIDVSGDPEAVDALRFTLDDETLGVMRDNDWKNIDGKATVRVTLPRVEKLVLAGSGRAEVDVLDGEAEVTIAGSGTAETANVDARSLEVTIAGSGTYRAAGRTERLELSIAGSGNAQMDGLQAGDAEVTIAGSGNAAFASDGRVEASIMGSGDVTVTGSAQCTISAMGSGSLNCRAGTSTANGEAPPPPPTAPAAPEAPQAPAE